MNANNNLIVDVAGELWHDNSTAVVGPLSGWEDCVAIAARWQRRGVLSGAARHDRSTSKHRGGQQGRLRTRGGRTPGERRRNNSTAAVGPLSGAGRTASTLLPAGSGGALPLMLASVRFGLPRTFNLILSLAHSGSYSRSDVHSRRDLVTSLRVFPMQEVMPILVTMMRRSPAADREVADGKERACRDTVIARRENDTVEQTEGGGAEEA